MKVHVFRVRTFELGRGPLGEQFWISEPKRTVTDELVVLFVLEPVPVPAVAIGHCDQGV